MATVSLPYTLQAGQPENVNQLVANLNALVSGVNTVDTAQIANSAVTPAKSATAVVSTIPTTGLVDGMEISYQSAGMATDGQVWRLKYRSGSSSDYKWEFVGGSGLTDTDFTQDGTTIANQTWTALDSSSDPTVTVPLAGFYAVRHFATISVGLSAAFAAIGVKFGSTEVTGTIGEGISATRVTTANDQYPLLSEFTKEITTASTSVTQRYYQDSAASRNMTRYGAGLVVVPVRVKA